MQQDLANLPPTPTLRERLAAAVADTRYLRSLLKIARQRDEAVGLAAAGKRSPEKQGGDQ
jgi:hypothetical protein